VRFTFPAAFNINEVKFYPRWPQNDRFVPRQFNVQVSLDGSKWTTVLPSTNITDFKKDFFDYTFKKVKAKFLKINFTKLDPVPEDSSKLFCIQLSEVQVIKAD
jgi:hypothetical protein